MANLNEISRTYDWMDVGFRIALGDHADITCAHYDGDFTKSLEQAQLDKKEWVSKHLRYSNGGTFLDIGSGWGNMLSFIKSKGAKGIGLTLSPAQQKHCAKKGLTAYIMDYKVAILVNIKGITAIGSPEHYCSPQEHLDGKQEEIYTKFFKFCAESMNDGGILYFHTMIWGDKGVPDYHKMLQSGPKGSDMWHLHMLLSFYPGSWLPASLDQIKKCAEPYFEFLENKNGRLDYIETMKQWGLKFRKELSWKKMSFKKIIYLLKTCVPALWNSERRKQLLAFWYKSNQYCFENGVMSHERMFFRKK